MPCDGPLDDSMLGDPTNFRRNWPMLSISQVTGEPLPMELLLLADPSPARLASYLPDSVVFVANEDGAAIGVAVLSLAADLGPELKNLAVHPAWRRRGIGQQLVRHVQTHVQSLGRSRLWVGTGNSSLGPLAFYQKLGFRLQGVVQDFFADDTPPIVEDGLRCRDLVRLVWTANAPAPSSASNLFPSRSASADPAAVVQRQLDAFNARDLDALLAIYADDAELFEHPAKLLARGTAELRERFAVRFREPNLHAALHQRIVMDPFVVDHETVIRTFPEGPGTIDLLMTYEIRQGRIARAWTLPGTKTLEGPPTR